MTEEEIEVLVDRIAELERQLVLRTRNATAWRSFARELAVACDLTLEQIERALMASTLTVGQRDRFLAEYQ